MELTKEQKEAWEEMRKKFKEKDTPAPDDLDLTKKVLQYFDENPNGIAHIIPLEMQEKFRQTILAKEAGASEEQTETAASEMLGELVGTILMKMLQTQEAILEELKKINEQLYYHR